MRVEQHLFQFSPVLTDALSLKASEADCFVSEYLRSIARDRVGLKGEAAKARIAELVANPTDEMFEQALDYGRYLTFQRPLDGWTQNISEAAQNNLLLKLFVPFIRTPTNLLKFATERSPAAPILKEWRKEFRAGGARRDMAVAKAMVGTGFGMAIYEAAANGLVTGSAPSDPKKSRLLYADGWKPYSVKIGDTYYSYKRLDPFATTIGVAADLATLPDGMSNRQREDKAALLIASIMGNLSNKTWLSGISDVVSALHESDRYAARLEQRLVGAFLVPGGVAQAARAMDPTHRKTETMGEYLRSRVPGLSDSLLPRRDIWGRPIVNGGGLGPDFISPVRTSQELNDPVNHELLQLDYSPGHPSKKVGGQELSPEDYDAYQEQAGRGAHAGLTDLVQTDEWDAMDDEDKVKAARKIVRDARKGVRDAMFAGEPAPVGAPPPPPGFLLDGPAPPPPPGFSIPSAAALPPPPGFTVD